MQIAPRIEGSWFCIDVEFDNTLPEPVFLMNWLMDWYGLLGDPSLTPDNPHAQRTRALAYVCLGTSGEAVFLNGKGPGASRNISMAVPRNPLGTRLMPGESFRSVIRQPLPLLEWYAYKRPAATPTAPVTITRVRYLLDRVRQSACKSTPPVEHHYFAGAWTAHGAPERLEAVATLSTPITLLRRTDDFTRFG